VQHLCFAVLRKTDKQPQTEKYFNQTTHFQ
jgi:hypothetical protein